jgi:hypothetical protein
LRLPWRGWVIPRRLLPVLVVVAVLILVSGIVWAATALNSNFSGTVGEGGIKQSLSPDGPWVSSPIPITDMNVTQGGSTTKSIYIKNISTGTFTISTGYTWTAGDPVVIPDGVTLSVSGSGDTIEGGAVKTITVTLTAELDVPIDTPIGFTVGVNIV